MFLGRLVKFWLTSPSCHPILISMLLLVFVAFAAAFVLPNTRGWQRAGAGVGFVLSAIVVLLPAYVVWPKSWWGMAGNSRVESAGSTLRVSGTIDAPMIRSVAWHLLRARREETVFYSYGGIKENARELLSLLNASGTTFRLRPKEVCASACVLLYARAARREADDGAFLGFHAGQWAVPWLYDAPPDDAREMEVWAAQISPALAAYFEQCEVHPATQEHFFFITVGRIKRIEAGRPENECDAQAKLKIAPTANGASR